MLLLWVNGRQYFLWNDGCMIQNGEEFDEWGSWYFLYFVFFFLEIYEWLCLKSVGKFTKKIGKVYKFCNQILAFDNIYSQYHLQSGVKNTYCDVYLVDTPSFIFLCKAKVIFRYIFSWYFWINLMNQ
jgi:hypothetical protein